MLALIAPFRTYTAALLSLLFAGCIAAMLHERGSTPVTVVTAVAPVVQPGEPKSFSFDVDAKWSAPKATAGCWYFSGPTPLGRDHTYGSAATMAVRGFTTDRGDGDITLSFGDAHFTGPVIDGGIAVRREGGSVAEGWLTSETIVGVDGDDTLEAVYHYTECQLDRDGSCVYSGRGDCRIDATVTLKLRG